MGLLVDVLGMRLAAPVAFLCFLSVACGAEDTDTSDLPLWEQVFGKWDCAANGRPAFAFEVIRKSAFGSDADWLDLGTQVRATASVTFTQLYLKGAGGQSFRNFEYTVEVSEVLHHLTEWSLTANGLPPYTCFQR